MFGVRPTDIRDAVFILALHCICLKRVLCVSIFVWPSHHLQRSDFPVVPWSKLSDVRPPNSIQSSDRSAHCRAAHLIGNPVIQECVNRYIQKVGIYFRTSWQVVTWVSSNSVANVLCMGLVMWCCAMPGCWLCVHNDIMWLVFAITSMIHWLSCHCRLNQII